MTNHGLAPADDQPSLGTPSPGARSPTPRTKGHAGTEKLACPSDREHDNLIIRDHQLHYLSCIPIKKRPDFWETTHPVWTKELEIQIKRLLNEAKWEARAKKALAERTEAEQTKAEQTKAEQTKAEQAKAEQAKAEQAKAEQTKAKPQSAGQDEDHEAARKRRDDIREADAVIAMANAAVAEDGTLREVPDRIMERAKELVDRKMKNTATNIQAIYNRAKYIRSATTSDAERKQEEERRQKEERKQAKAADMRLKEGKHGEAATNENPGTTTPGGAAKCFETSLLKWRQEVASRLNISADDCSKKAAELAKKEDTALKLAAGNDETSNGTVAADECEARSSGTAGSAKVEQEEYEVEKDLSAYVIRLRLPQSADANASSRPAESVFSPTSDAPEACKVKGVFPDQKVKVHDLLEHKHENGTGEDVNCILSSKSPKDRINYVHIPCNNMEYVEKLIPKYYGDDPLSLDDDLLLERSKWSRSGMLLRPQYWRGQQHGSQDTSPRLPVHAWHMRAMCEMISSDPPAEYGRKLDSIALFMPFLHWEFGRYRAKISQVIDEESALNRKKMADRERNITRQRRQEWKNAESTDAERHRTDSVPTRPLQGQIDGVSDVARAFLKQDPIEIDSGRVKAKQKLGQLLIDAARLCEEILLFRDKKLIQKYLFKKAPIHPRRTLDQSYYWTLKSTKNLDRGQVVYRGTDMDRKLAHKLREKGAKKNSRLHQVKNELLSRGERFLHLGRGAGGTGKKKVWELFGTVGDHIIPEPSEKRTEHPAAKSLLSTLCLPFRKQNPTEHAESEEKMTCEQCRSDICKRSCVVMVDQLWMWILDEHTIITCFPRSYGYNKKGDHSGVFKSIRLQFEEQTSEIRSVFDLALIILRECSNTLLNQSRTQDKRPQVIDIFAEAIGRIDHKLSQQFDSLWHWTQSASKLYHSKRNQDEAEELYSSLLDICREGQLLNDIRSIVDELTIMIGIKKKQKELILRFTRFAERFLDKTGSHSRKLDAHGEASASDDRQDTPMNDGTKAIRSFRQLASDLQSEISDRIGELEALKESAVSTAQDAKDLLELKQQQASVVQAWQAVKQGEETARQSRAITIFTVVTIFFLPLSFMSSVFGMNNTTFDTENGSGMTLGQQFMIMFPVSFGIIIPVVIGAFSKFARSLCWMLFRICTTWIAVKLKMYWVWLDWFDKVASSDLTEWAENKVQHWKDKEETKHNKSKKKSKEKQRNPPNCPQQQQQQPAQPSDQTSNPAADPRPRGCLDSLRRNRRSRRKGNNGHHPPSSRPPSSSSAAANLATTPPSDRGARGCDEGRQNPKMSGANGVRD